MNAFFYSAVVLCAVCAVLECLLPKNAGELGALCSLFVILSLITVFSVSDGFEMPSSEPIAYEDLSSSAFCAACEEKVAEICAEYGIFPDEVEIVSFDGTIVEKMIVRADKNSELSDRLEDIFGCEVLFE